jgi:hypothetical protein
MTFKEIARFITEYKDTLTIIAATLGGVVALGTFFKAILEYRLQGRQKRAELFDKLITRIHSAPLSPIITMLENENIDLQVIPIAEIYYLIGLFEQVAIAVNSGLIRKRVAYYMFGYYALLCRYNEHLINEIDWKSPYWKVFNQFAEEMRTIQNRNANPTFFPGLFHKIFYSRLYRF